MALYEDLQYFQICYQPVSFGYIPSPCSTLIWIRWFFCTRSRKHLNFGIYRHRYNQVCCALYRKFYTRNKFLQVSLIRNSFKQNHFLLVPFFLLFDFGSSSFVLLCSFFILVFNFAFMFISDSEIVFPFVLLFMFVLFCFSFLLPNMFLFPVRL